MKQLKEIIVGLIVWGFPAILLGQSSVSGTVTDENGETVAGANIRIEGTYRGTHSDAAGKYSLSGLPEGAVTLVITFIGYESQSQAVTVSDQPQTLDVSLKRSAVMADEVVIKATRASDQDPIAHTNISK
ncbi:MAG: carboxypeptidase-like regulatory domain-containing protein, partial [Bacteroidota bacterium]